MTLRDAMNLTSFQKLAIITTRSLGLELLGGVVDVGAMHYIGELPFFHIYTCLSASY
jgi:hypothetical protein